MDFLSLNPPTENSGGTLYFHHFYTATIAPRWPHSFGMNNSMQDEEENIRITENDLPQEFILKLLGQHEARGLWGIKHTREPVDVMVKYAKTHELSLPIVQVVVTREGIFMSPVRCRLDNRSRENISIRKIGTGHHSDRRFVSPKIPVNETWNDTGMTKAQGKPCNNSQTLLKQMKENYEKRKTGCKNQAEELNCFASKKLEEKRKGTPTDLQLLEKYSRFDWRKRGIFFFGIDTISYGVQDLIFTRVFSMIVLTDRKTNSVRGGSPFMCHAFVCESRNTARRVTYALAAAFQAYGKSMKFIRGDEKPTRKSYEDKPKKFTLELRPPIEVAFNDSEA